MDYIVVTALDKKDINIRVNEKLAQGYVLQGGICMAWNTSVNDWYLAQALVKTIKVK